ncbi:DUF1573 domain-containing protein [Segatella buccae]|jgi:hypothetical protein|uniref:DUF1573 domain-containing protein n=1 Tax=Segatella buccae TaxID=28126 RepID=UPI003C6EF819
MKNHYRYILIILLVILQSLHGYAFHSLKKVNVNAVTSDKIMHQRYASFVEFNSVNSFKKYSKKRGVFIFNIRLKNKSKERLYISDIVNRCSCIKATFSKNLIGSNQELAIIVEYKPYTNSGYFNKSIMILFNGGKYYYIYSLKGFEYGEKLK